MPYTCLSKKTLDRVTHNSIKKRIIVFIYFLLLLIKRNHVSSKII